MFLGEYTDGYLLWMIPDHRHLARGGVVAILPGDKLAIRGFLSPLYLLNLLFVQSRQRDATRCRTICAIVRTIAPITFI